MEWDGTRSDDGAGTGGVALDWVFTVEGGARVCVCRDSQGVMRGGWNELGWVGIGESLTGHSIGKSGCLGRGAQADCLETQPEACAPR